MSETKTLKNRMEDIKRATLLPEDVQMFGWQTDEDGHREIDLTDGLRELISIVNQLVALSKDLVSQSDTNTEKIQNQQNQITKLDREWDGWLDNFKEELPEGVNEGERPEMVSNE